MRGWVLWCSVIAVASACADSPRASDDDDGSGSTSQSTSTSAQSTSGSGASSSASSGAGGETAQTPYCQATCGNPADCTLDSAPYDDDNFSCTDGTCTYLGCNSDSECQTLGAYVCRPSGPLMLCQLACVTAADCSLGSPAYDADNYSCLGGACVYQGCNSDSECQMLGNLVCRETGAVAWWEPGAGTNVKFCVPACATPADCALDPNTAYDADNYSCANGYCEYLGCHSDSECQSLGDYVCK